MIMQLSDHYTVFKTSEGTVPSADASEELESLSSIVLLFRKLREGVVASHRIDDFAVEGVSARSRESRVSLRNLAVERFMAETGMRATAMLIQVQFSNHLRRLPFKQVTNLSSSHHSMASYLDFTRCTTKLGAKPSSSTILQTTKAKAKAKLPHPTPTTTTFLQGSNPTP